MTVGVCRLTLHLPESRSLKDKRSVVKSVLDRLGAKNVSAAEVDAHDLWQRAELGFAVVSRDRAGAESALRAALADIEGWTGLKSVDAEVEFH